LSDRSQALLLVLALSLGMAAACSSSYSTDPGAPAPSPTLTITGTGVSPNAVTIDAGSQVTFVNADSVAHTVFSGPHPEHTDCPALNQVGFLMPGERRQSGNLNASGNCTFHDEGSPFNEIFQGAIVVR
jgi:plastocyanin